MVFYFLSISSRKTIKNAQTYFTLKKIKNDGDFLIASRERNNDKKIQFRKRVKYTENNTIFSYLMPCVYVWSPKTIRHYNIIILSQ